MKTVSLREVKKVAQPHSEGVIWLELKPKHSAARAQAPDLLCSTAQLPSLVAQMVKSPPAMQETQVQSLGQEDPPEEEMATNSRILAWGIPWAVEPDDQQTMESQRIGHD